MKTFLLTFALASLAAAQTAPRPDQLRAPADEAPRIYVFLPSGQALVAVFDASLVLDMSGPVPILRAVAAHAVIREALEVSKANGPLTGLVCVNTPLAEPEVQLNGIGLAPGEDYTRAGRQITLLRPAQPGDIIKLRYRW